jgi:hypothetical protein
VRITYWIAPGRRIILLTVLFRKTRMREDREIDRARRALANCLAASHAVEDEKGQ